MRASSHDNITHQTIGSCALALASLSPALSAQCSDHLDTPTVIADPATGIGDLYAWMSPDGKRLNLVMDIARLPGWMDGGGCGM